MASPLRTSLPRYAIFSGMFLNTFALFVITSPTVPFPLVTALSNSPFSYVRTIVSPSIFQESKVGCVPINALKTSLSLVLSNESIGDSCVSFGSTSTASYPTLTVGLSARTIPVSFSIFSS